MTHHSLLNGYNRRIYATLLFISKSERVISSVGTSINCFESGRRLGLNLAAGVNETVLRAQGVDPETIFTGEGYGPEPLSATEKAALEAPVPEDLAELDWPDWLRPALRADLGAGYGAISEAMRARAPVILRVNIARTDPKKAAEMLSAEGIVTQPHPLVATALEVIEGARKVHRSAAYMNGLVELQDAASQAATALVPLAPGMRVLDYCAGGGGKALALAAACPEAEIHAHDADPARLRDLPVRAARAGAEIALCPPGAPGTVAKRH